MKKLEQVEKARQLIVCLRQLKEENYNTSYLLEKLTETNIDRDYDEDYLGFMITLDENTDGKIGITFYPQIYFNEVSRKFETHTAEITMTTGCPVIIEPEINDKNCMKLREFLNDYIYKTLI